jgi:hypothetical protein
MTKKSSSEKKPRLPQRKRISQEELPTFRLTRRDQEIIRAVYEYRVLTTNQIETLFFPRSTPSADKPVSSRCVYRLKLLFHGGFLKRGEVPHLLEEGRKPFLYFLDRRGAQLLSQLDDIEIADLDWRPGQFSAGDLYLEHLMATNDVRVSIVSSSRKHGYTIETWLDDNTLKSVQMKDVVTLTGPQGATQRASVVPDGYFHLFDGAHHYHQFLEVDRRTVTGSSKVWGKRTWARKVAVYLEYYNSGQYHERYRTKSMRILTVTTGERRLLNMKEVTEAEGGKARFWFTTFDALLQSDVLHDAIWHVAGRSELSSLVWE